MKSLRPLATRDHRMKQTLRKLNESTVEHFGQSGESVLGICVYYRQGNAEDGNHIETRYFDYVIDDNRQNPQQVQSVMDCFMGVDLPGALPTVSEVVFLSDNGTAFAAFDQLPWIFSRNQENWYRGGEDQTLRVSRMLFYEAQKGKGVVDCHFAFLGKQVERAVKSGVVVGPPSTIFEAFTLGGGIMNTVTVLITVNAREKVESFKPSSAINLGVRRVHDIIFLDDESNKCRAYSQIDSSFVCEIKQTEKAAGSVQRPTYSVERNKAVISGLTADKSRSTSNWHNSSSYSQYSFQRQR